MNCTHPVIYRDKNGAAVCHICGAVVGEPPEAGKYTTGEPKPAEAKKTGRKRKADK